MANNKQVDDWTDVPLDDTDDWQEVAIEKPKKFISPTESAVRGLAQGATLGFADELAGGLGALGDIALGGKPLASFGESYERERDESRAAYDAAKEYNPKTYLASEIGGGIGTAFIPGLGALNAARGAQIGTVVAKGALQGGLMGLGSSTGDDVAELALDTTKGAALGAGGGAAGYGLGKAAGGVADSLADSKVGQYLLSKYKGLSGGVANKLDELAEVQGARALGLERATQKKLGQDATRAVGRQALDENILKIGSNTEDLIGRNEALKKAALSSREAAYKQIDDAGASQFDPLEVAAAVEDKVLGKMNRSYDDTKDIIKKLEPELQNILSRGDGNLPMMEAQQLVQNLGKKAKFDMSRSTQANDMAKDVYSTVRKYINEAAGSDKVGIPGLKDVITGANKKYSVAKDADKLLQNKQARELGNKTFGLTDNVMGAGALASSNPIFAVPLIAAKKVSEKYGNQTAAITADKLADFVRQSPEMLGKYRPVLEKAIQRGGSSVAVTNYLLQQKDPEYRKLMNEKQDQ